MFIKLTQKCLCIRPVLLTVLMRVCCFYDQRWWFMRIKEWDLHIPCSRTSSFETSHHGSGRKKMPYRPSSVVYVCSPSRNIPKTRHHYGFGQFLETKQMYVQKSETRQETNQICTHKHKQKQKLRHMGPFESSRADGSVHCWWHEVLETAPASPQLYVLNRAGNGKKSSF